jgi:hypothetical protein
MTKLSALVTALAVLGMAGNPAGAQTPSPSQAKALEAEITQWLRQLTAGSVPLPEHPVQLTAEGDHYLVRVPLAPLGTVEPPDAAFTAKARPLDGTRWAIDDEQFPSELKVTTTEQLPNPPDPKGPGQGTHSAPVTYQIKLGQQDGHRVFDPSYATPTTSSGTVASVDVVKTGGMAASITHTGRTTAQSSTRPTDPAHVDLLTDITTDGYATQAQRPDGETIELTAEHIHVVGALSGVAHDQIFPLIHMGAALAQAAKAEGDHKEPTPADKAQMHAILVAAHGLLTGGKMDETIEGIKLAFNGQSAAISKLELSLGGDAPQDMLSATMGLTLDGLNIASLPPMFAAYVPTHIAIRPTISNLSIADLTEMGLEATAPPPRSPPPGGKMAVPMAAAQRLFSHGGINFGFDTLALDIVGTRFSGTGKFTMTGPQSVTGAAEIDASGLDGLIAKAQSDPMLAQAVPVIIFLKGIAKTNGDQAVWQITVANTKVLVNGVDLSAMANGMK